MVSRGHFAENCSRGGFWLEGVFQTWRGHFKPGGHSELEIKSLEEKMEAASDESTKLLEEYMQKKTIDLPEKSLAMKRRADEFKVEIKAKRAKLAEVLTKLKL